METVLLILAAVVGGWWVLNHLSAFNRRGCPSCKGTGKKRSSLIGSRYKTCRRCGGKGEVRAFGGRPE
jgi:hypothetical protein